MADSEWPSTSIIHFSRRAPSRARTRILIRFWRVSTPALALFLQALEEANRRADEIKTLAELVLEEPLIAEVQALGLIGEQDECRRRAGCLRDVVDLHPARGGRGAAVQVHFGKPAVQLAGGDAPAARLADAVDQSEQLIRPLASQRGDKHNRSVIEKLESRPQNF